MNKLLQERINRYSNRENVLVIAEADVNHNGSLKTALKLCEAAKYAGADVVKFQNLEN